MTLMNKSARINRYAIAMFLCGGILLASEIWKQYILTYQVYGFYKVWYVPFQLCSLPMYLCTVYPLVSESWKERIQVFLMTFSLLGGAAAFLDTSGMQYPIRILTVHSYSWHVMVVAIGICSGINWCKRESDHEKNFHATLPIWLGALGIATILNLSLSSYGEINMFYISPIYPSWQLIIRDLVPVIGQHASNLIYLAVMYLSARILFWMWSFVKGRAKD